MITPTRARPASPVPAGAETWACWHIYTEKGATGQHGRRGKRCKGEPLDNGEIPEAWPVAQFSIRGVLEMWGPGRYRVDFYDGNGVLMKGQGYPFECAAPKKKKGPRLGRHELEADDGPALGSGDELPARRPKLRDGMAFTDVYAMLLQERRQTEEGAQRRLEQQRLEAQQAMQQQQAQQNFMLQLLTTVMGGKGGGVDSELIRREIGVAVREMGLGIRADLAQAQAASEQADDDDEDERDPPANAEEAVDGLIAEALGALESEVPGMIRDVVLPKVGEWLNLNGGRLTPQTAAKVNAAASVITGSRRHANGA